MSLRSVRPETAAWTIFYDRGNTGWGFAPFPGRPKWLKIFGKKFKKKKKKTETSPGSSTVNVLVDRTTDCVWSDRQKAKLTGLNHIRRFENDKNTLYNICVYIFMYINFIEKRASFSIISQPAASKRRIIPIEYGRSMFRTRLCECVWKRRNANVNGACVQSQWFLNIFNYSRGIKRVIENDLTRPSILLKHQKRWHFGNLTRYSKSTVCSTIFEN